MAEQATPITFRKATSMPVGRDRLLNLIEISLDPFVLVVSLWVVAWIVTGTLLPRHVILALVVFSLTFPGSLRLTQTLPGVVRHIIVGWLAVSGLLFLFGYLTGYLRFFDRDMLVTWWWAAPISQFFAQVLLRLSTPAILRFQGPLKRAIIAGVNESALELARRVRRDPYARVRVVGFFDDRGDKRLQLQGQYSVLGKIQDLPRFANENDIDLIYISLPMASQPRILALLDGLRDTTSSIYFVPDIFITELIQGRMDAVLGLPIVAVCETPFTGLDGVIKRGSDIVLSLLILALLSPLLLAIAVGVKLSSPGPAIFRQRRYGLDGKEIIVYKFRTMTVGEDGAVIRQASRRDTRVTRFGAFLRRTSMDELPQFINVLEGRMSIVGPRPHAVAHNEMYRKLIKGYMLRHKVKPGITGWAQVNGLRGETEILEKMKARIDFDLDYLRNWSLRLDLYIIAKTVWVIFKEQKNAY
jgi:putative colanic acid biosynthesis UDP-glucose lipid carrier transferase